MFKYILLAGAAGLFGAAPVPALSATPAALLPRPGLHALENPGSAAAVSEPLTGWHRNRTYKAALLSALVPGLGEYYTGHPNRALLSGTAEAAVWTSFITFRVQEGLRADRAEQYAVAFAGANASGDDDYFKAVAQFLRNDGPGMWNEFVRRRARDSGEIVGREYNGNEAWSWTSLERFIEYRTLRKDKLKAHDHARNAIAVAIANRIVSVISVVQAVHADAHRDQERTFGLKLEMGVSPVQHVACVGLRNRF